MSAELDVAVSAARAAGALLHDRFRTGIGVSFKGRRDIVTDADLDSEELVRRMITDAFPGDVVVGEEGEQPGEDEVGGRRRWYVDPLDGTTNYVKGRPRWAVSVAFCDADDRLAAAAIVRPCEGEEYTARRGHGAWMNGSRVYRDDDPAYEDALALVGPLADGDDAVRAIARQSLSIRITGSTVSDLADLATGRGDLHLGRRQGRWDLGAGILLLREAGLTVTDLAGTPIDGPDDSIVAAPPTVHARTIALLRGLAEGPC